MRVLAVAFTALLLLSHSGFLAAADEVPRRYSIKQDDPDTGTGIRHDVVRGSVVPLNKTYAELTPAEQDRLKSLYERMGPNDEPPFPLGGLAPIYKAIADGQQRLRVTGQLSVAVQVDSRGEATAVSVFGSPDPAMTRFAASVLMLQKYKPALCNGTPCDMQFPFRMTFELRRR